MKTSILILLAALSPVARANVPAKDLATLVVGVDLQQRKDPHLNVEDDGELVTITVWPRLGERPSETERRGRDAIEKWRRRNPWQKAPFYSSVWARKSDGRIYALYIHLYYGTCAPPLLPVPAPPPPAREEVFFSGYSPGFVRLAAASTGVQYAQRSR